MIHKVGDIVKPNTQHWEFYWQNAQLEVVSVVKELNLYVVRVIGDLHPILYWIPISETKENNNDEY